MDRGKRYRSQSKAIITNVFNYFEETGKKGGCSSLVDRTSKATGLCCTHIIYMGIYYTCAQSLCDSKGGFTIRRKTTRGLRLCL